jgi:hypothetical protein
MSDYDLQRDFTYAAGRLLDGTSPAKLPGISLDNGAYNEAVFNTIDRNFGGGIKMVRTGFHNVVGLNTIMDNNQGESKDFHFFGIELGAAPSDAPYPELDFHAQPRQ